MRLLAEPKPKAAKAGPEPLPENNMMQMDWADVDANTFSTLKRPQGCAGRLLTKRLEKISNAPVKDCGDVKRVIKTFGGGIKKFEKALTPNLTHLGKSIGVWRAMFALINPTQEPQAHKIWRRSVSSNQICILAAGPDAFLLVMTVLLGCRQLGRKPDRHGLAR